MFIINFVLFRGSENEWIITVGFKIIEIHMLLQILITLLKYAISKDRT